MSVDYRAAMAAADACLSINRPSTLEELGAAAGPPWRSASSVEATKVRWLWYPRIPLGKLTLIAGDPGVGKGYVTAAITAAVTIGDALPGFVPRQGTVLWASFEDAASDTLRPRLEAQGADLDRVLLLDQWRDAQGHPRPMSPADVPELERWLERVPDARLLVIDPIGSYVGGSVDTHRDNEVRAVLQPLVNMAERRGIAVLVICHLNKAELMKAIHRVAGSIGFVGLARSVLAVGKEDQSGRRGVAHGKTNVGPEALTVEYRIVPGPTLEDVATLEWMGETLELTKELLLGSAPKRPGPEPEEREAAKEGILMLLADGPRPAAECLDYFRSSELISDSTVNRAKKELGVICEQVKGSTGKSGSPGWTWRLPEDQAIRLSRSVSYGGDNLTPDQKGDQEVTPLTREPDNLTSDPPEDGPERGFA